VPCKSRRPLPPVPCKSSGGLCSILFIFINTLFILINPSCPHVLISHQPLFGSALLGSARLGSVERCSSKRATSSACLPCAPSPSLLTGIRL
jgi:hypothetical protein